MDLSIIIVNFNTRDLTLDCIQSIHNNITQKLSYEIILVDNNSSDESSSAIKERFSNVIVIENKENLGFTKANNIGIKRSKGRYVLLLNSDTLLKSDLNKTIKYLDENINVGVLGCKVLNKDGSLQYSSFHMPNIFTEVAFFSFNIIKKFRFDPIDYWKYMKYWKHDNIQEVDCVSGCFMMIRHDIFSQVGFLDEKIFMYYEDSDFCYRVNKSNFYKVSYFSLDTIYHLSGKSGKYIGPQKVITAYKSWLYLLHKIYGVEKVLFFQNACRVLWIVVILILFPLSFLKKFKQKIDMVKSLYDEKK